MSIPEVDAVLALTRGPRVEAPFEHDDYRALFARTRGATSDVLDPIVRALLPGLAAPDVDHAACVAITAGTLVEQGASPAIAGRAIVQRLGETAALAPDEPRAVRYLVLAAMAHLARDIDLRAWARARPGLSQAMDQAEEHVSEAWFVSEALLLADDVDLLVLAPASRRGYRVRVTGVRSNYHLFTLLQGALVGDPSQGWLSAEPTDAAVLAAATGERAPLRELTDHARFAFHSVEALARDGSVGGSIMTSLWSGDVETGAMSIPLARVGEGLLPVIVLGPTILGSISWGSTFFAGFHDALRSRADVIEKLSEAETEAAIRSVLG